LSEERSAQTAGPDIRAGRLTADEYAHNFCDAHPRLTPHQALLESDRCYFCYDAPCVRACPTGIDIPSFIRKISTGNIKGSAHDILSQNIMGAVCARVCPTEVLCEGSCVRNQQEHKPVAIGALQRYATDWLFERNMQLFRSGPSSGRHIAVVGGGPAGLSCAHRLAVLGHAVTVFEARDKLGGLNEFGVAAYKVAGEVAQREVRYLLEVGGINVETSLRLGPDLSLARLRQSYDAVFLGIGIGAVNDLGIDAPPLLGIFDAIDYIATLRQAQDLGKLLVGRRIVVIGGGMTAIDIATQTRLLGAEDVTIVYRRGPDQMGASEKEQTWAQTNGVRIKHWARPVRLIAPEGALRSVELEYTRADGPGQVVGTGERFILEADMLFKAIGQVLVRSSIDGALELLDTRSGRIAVDAERRTTIAGVWAGGDCVAGGKDLTVVAVEDGKIAAQSIDRFLRSAQAAGVQHG
jgi:glutamate synthase (NADPH/NADH) small chain